MRCRHGTVFPIAAANASDGGIRNGKTGRGRTSGDQAPGREPHGEMMGTRYVVRIFVIESADDRFVEIHEILAEDIWNVVEPGLELVRSTFLPTP